MQYKSSEQNLVQALITGVKTETSMINEENTKKLKALDQNINNLKAEIDDRKFEIDKIDAKIEETGSMI